ncbi:MAG: divalent metal cation transporter [Thermaerobacter sp.]|nr:divalent metal cation transporter [Thermaerobacter sp.]
MQHPNLATDTPPPGSGFRRSMAVWLLAIGPGVLGLTADNDAGGVLSYLLTGAFQHLWWFVGGLIAMAPATYTIQELALRVAIATRHPYGKLLSLKYGKAAARANGIILHGLNTVILVTEFLGMASALNLFGVPWTGSALLSWILVLTVTSFQRYARVERLLLWIAGINLVFVPILFLLHPSAAAWRLAFNGGFSGRTGFLLLALAGNAIAPWMIYWQQNAVWAGNVGSLADGRKDIRMGVIAQVGMASVVLMIGALSGKNASWQNPLAWLATRDGRWVGDLFALGIYNAGFLAACTISLSSAWMVQEVWYAEAVRGHDDNPARGALGKIHLASVTLAAAVAAWPRLAVGSVALWAQALGALWMPVSLALLACIAADRRIMGPMAIRSRRRVLVVGLILSFVALAVFTL